MTTMTDAEIIAAESKWADTLSKRRLLALARIGAKVVAADDATVERVARALCAAQDADWGNLDTRGQWHWCAIARAALASVGE